jgi:hypothetical protein
MTIFLYVKTHNITGLKYLGQTSKPDVNSYPGSGKYWKRHIAKHGNDVATEIIMTCKNITEIRKWGLFYSTIWDILENDEWANLKEEAGQGGQQSSAVKKKMSQIKKDQFASGKITPWNKGITLSIATRKKISESQIGRKLSIETIQKMKSADRSTYTRTAPVSAGTRLKLSNLLKNKPGRATGYKWTDEQKQKLSKCRSGQPSPTKGMKRVYRDDGTFYFKNP